MIAADTNVVVRLLTRDDKEQSRSAEHLFRENQVFVPDTVLLETVWVLTSAYSFEPSQIVDGLKRLLGLPTVVISNAEAISNAVAWYEQGLDFADALHLATSQNAGQLATFDREFVKRARGMGRCPVIEVASAR